MVSEAESTSCLPLATCGSLIQRNSISASIVSWFTVRDEVLEGHEGIRSIVAAALTLARCRSGRQTLLRGRDLQGRRQLWKSWSDAAVQSL
jgi:hypothetical protein